MLTVNWQLFQVDKLTAPTPAANLRCRVLPRVRPHPDLSLICTPIFGRFSAGGLTRGKTLQRRALSRIVADMHPDFRRLSAANLRCRVLPRVRPHPDVRTGDSPLSLHNRLLFYYQSAKQATIYAIAKDCASECRTLSSLECYAERSQAYQTLVCSSLVLVCSWGYFSTNTMEAAMAFTMPLAASNL